MSLTDKWVEFAKQQNEKLGIDKKVRVSKEFLLQHQGKVDIAVEVAKTAIDFAFYKSPFVFMRGAGLILNEVVGDINSSFSYFHKANGWLPVFDTYNQAFNFTMASPLDCLPYRELTFVSDRQCAKIYTSSVGDIVVIRSIDNDYSVKCIMHRKTTNNDEVVKFIVDLKMKELNSNILALSVDPGNNEDGVSYGLDKAELNIQQSAKADELTAYYTRAFDLGIKRSVILYGPPGSGKTSLAHTLVHNLGLKTMIYNPSEYGDNDSTYLDLVDLFGIEACILDDFDHMDDTQQMLSFLDALNKKTKLVIGIVNNMQAFHPAVVRPRRFDEYHLIDSIEETGVRSILNGLGDEYFERTKKWPVAYLNELVNRSKLYPIDELEKHFNELNDRANNQLANLGKQTDDDDDE